MPHTRRIIAYDNVSADGYFTTSDARLDWSVPEPALHRSAVAGMSGRGAVLFGRRTFDGFESFWPNVVATAGRDAPAPHTPGHESPELRAMATWLDDADKLVVSTTRDASTWRNTRFVRALDPRAIESLKQEPGGDIMLFGSGSVVSQLTEHALVDEYQFIVAPLFLGAGRSLIDRVAKRVTLRLLEARSFDSGNVFLRYAPVG